MQLVQLEAGKLLKQPGNVRKPQRNTTHPIILVFPTDVKQSPWRTYIPPVKSCRFITTTLNIPTPRLSGRWRVRAPLCVKSPIPMD